jgi:hypothetical protein
LKQKSSGTTIIQKNKQIKIMETKINELIKKIYDFESIQSNINSNNNNTTNNIINNTQHNTQHNTQNNNNVKINNYGEEDISYITKETYKNLLIDPRNSISKLIDATHFNSDHPENSNIRIPNKKQPFIELYIDNTWKVCNQYKTVCNILKCKKDFIHNIFIERQDELTTKQKISYLDYKELIDKDLFIVKQVLTDIRATIITGTRSGRRDVFINIKDENKEDPTQKLLDQIPESFLYENDSSGSDSN